MIKTLAVLLGSLLAVTVLIVRELAESDPAVGELVLLGLVALLLGFELVDRYRTERRLAREVAERGSRLDFVVEQVPVVVYVADPGEISRWHFVNGYVETLLGFTPQEWLADPDIWRRQVHPDDLPLAMSDERRSLHSGAPNATDYRIRTKTGQERWVRDVAMPSGQEGRPVVQGIIYDITELKRAEHVARGRERMLRVAVGEKTRELERSRLETMQRLAIAAELHEEGARDHTLRVGRTAARLARALGLSPPEVELIAQAAPLHDVGKLGVSNAILLKPGPLTESELETMRQHTTIGARILSGSQTPALRMAEEVALTHHERWDGSGYPQGLAGEAIPIVGRITQVADVFDALTHERPYKEAWPVDRAVAEIQAGSGSMHDPAVVDAFLALDVEGLLLPIRVGPVGGRPEPTRI